MSIKVLALKVMKTCLLIIFSVHFLKIVVMTVGGDDLFLSFSKENLDARSWD